MTCVASVGFSNALARLPVIAAGILVMTGSAVLAHPRSVPGASSTPQGGSVCIAIVLPSVNGIEGNATDMGSVVRELFGSYLKGPSLQVLNLDARLASLAMAEARQKDCSHVLTATLMRKRGGGGALRKVLGGAAGSAAWHIPGGSTVGAAAARGAAVGAAHAAASLATSTRSKDEMRLEYRISSSAGATEVGPKTETLKAKADGEDILTPLIEKAAETIVAALVKS